MEKLIIKYLHQSLNLTELQKLSEWIKDTKNIPLFEQYVKNHFEITYGMVNPDTEKIKRKLLKEIRKDKYKYTPFKKFTIKKILPYAATLVLLICSGYFLLVNQIENKNTKKTNSNQLVEDVFEPGENKAILTLDDGSFVALNKDAKYEVDNTKSDGESITYTAKKTSDTQLTYNYLSVPRSGEFLLKLSDGTKVWLNSETRIKYPTHFIKGQAREVELLYGEAFFEVSPSTLHGGDAFKVLNQNQLIEVVGTQFNVKAYKDDYFIKTTLVEGTITVDNEFKKATLKPNEQLVLSTVDHSFKIVIADVFDEASWKNGFFSFKDIPLNDIMEVLSRWYDVDVFFENQDLKGKTFGGVFKRKQGLLEILSLIESTEKVTFKINEKTIIVK